MSLEGADPARHSTAATGMRIDLRLRLWLGILALCFLALFFALHASGGRLGELRHAALLQQQKVSSLAVLDHGIADLYRTVEELRRSPDASLLRLAAGQAGEIRKRITDVGLLPLPDDRSHRLSSIDEQYGGIRMALAQALETEDAELRGALVEAVIAAVYANTFGFRKLILAGNRELHSIERSIAQFERSQRMWILLGSMLLLVLCAGFYLVVRQTAIRPLEEMAGRGVARLSTDEIRRWEEHPIPELRHLGHTLLRLHRSRQRLRERSRRDLDALKAKVEEAGRLRNDFLAAISHEIRTPLNNLVGNLELLDASPGRGSERTLIGRIQDAVDQLLEVINDLLAFSRLENESFELSQVDFDLHSLLESVCDAHMRTAHDKKLELVCLIEQDVPFRLQGDAARLRQILHNLTGNAVKFTDAGEVALRVSRMHQAEGKVTVCFEIRDTGIGMEPDQMATLFEPFVQADGSLSRRHEGLGLGLSISRRLVEMMGGRITARSKPGAGSIFTFKIQFDLLQAGLPQVAGGQRLLLVEHNPLICEAVHCRLQALGVDSTDVDDLETALHLLRDPQWSEWRPRVILISWEVFSNCRPDQLQRLQRELPAETLRVLLAPSSLAENDQLDLQQFSAILTRPVRSLALASLFQEEGVHSCEGLRRVLPPKEQQAKKEEKPPAGPASGVETGYAGYRILAVDDNPVNLSLIQNLLRRRDYRVDTAVDGLEALERMVAEDFDLVLMDCMMPRLDGLSATRRFRQEEAGKWTRIVALTANAVGGDRERCISAGMDDYLEKPVRRRALFALLDRYLPRQENGDVQEALSGEAEAVSSKVPAAEESEESAVRLDLSLLRDDSEGDVAFEQELIRLFLRDAERRLNTLEEAIGKSESEVVHLEAHTVKGICAGIGAQIMREIAFELEQQGSQGQLGEAPGLLGSLRREYEEVRQELEQYLDQCRQPSA